MRHVKLDIPLSEDEKKELQEAAARSASPVATWARSVLIREARREEEDANLRAAKAVS